MPQAARRQDKDKAILTNQTSRRPIISRAHIGEGQFGGVAERRSNASRTLSRRARVALMNQGRAGRSGGGGHTR